MKISELWKKLIVSLDIREKKRFKEVVSGLSSRVKKFKIGPVSYLKFGPAIITYIKNKGGDIFLDFKLYDIPNTMIETAKNIVDLGVWAFTVHLASGVKSLTSLKDEIYSYAEEQRKMCPIIVGVTELTSRSVSSDKVVKKAEIAYKSGIPAVVCSVWEAKRIKKEFGLITITPGIRGNRDIFDDQKRIATVKDAVDNGVDYFVVGRPIIEHKDCLSAAVRLLKG